MKILLGAGHLAICVPASYLLNPLNIQKQNPNFHLIFHTVSPFSLINLNSVLVSLMFSREHSPFKAI